MYGKGFTNNLFFIRMILLWFMVVLFPRCSSSGEILPDSAELSSTDGINVASRALDNNHGTSARTNIGSAEWLRIYFKGTATVDNVVVQRGLSYDAACVFTVSVYDGVTRTVCGMYTGHPG